MTGVQTCALAAAHPTDNGFYQCLIDGHCGSIATNPVLLTVVPACIGDLNYDGFVNTADLTIFLGDFGSPQTPYTGGDLNGDGQVNTSDLTTFLGRFGQPCP